jgi:hypothetical protein
MEKLKQRIRTWLESNGKQNYETFDRAVVKLIEEKGFVNLDVGCGGNKQPNFIGMDKRKLPSVDVVHDLEVFPYPIPPDSCNTIVGSHIVEHIAPQKMIDFMNELWRICKVGGKVCFRLPYGWSYGYIQDPTHCNPCNEATWEYFDPTKYLWGIYQPKPFFVEMCTYQVTGNMEVVLRKLSEKEGKEKRIKFMK